MAGSSINSSGIPKLRKFSFIIVGLNVMILNIVPSRVTFIGVSPPYYLQRVKAPQNFELFLAL